MKKIFTVLSGKGWSHENCESCYVDLFLTFTDALSFAERLAEDYGATLEDEKKMIWMSNNFDYIQITEEKVDGY